LKLDFSDDGGFTYYTEDPNFTCPRQYIGNKIQDMEGLVALTAKSVTSDSEKNRILKDGRRLIPSREGFDVITRPVVVVVNEHVRISRSIASFVCRFFCSF